MTETTRKEATTTAGPTTARRTEDRRGYLWLLVGATLGAVATGRWTVPAAAWLTGIFLLRFFRTRRLRSAVPVAAIAIAATFFVGWRGLIPYGGDAAFVGMALVAGLLGTLPFVIDRVLHHRLGAVAGTLVYPASVTALEFLGTLSGDFAGSWGGVGYSQFGGGAVVQLAAVTGLAGITFLVSWLAPVANHLWERDFDLRRSRGPVLGFAAVLATVLVAGGLRVATAPADLPRVRMAAIAEPALSGPEGIWPTGDVAATYFGGGELEADRWAEIEARMADAHERLLARTRAEAAAGARIVFWAEANAPVRARDEAALVARGAELARAEDLYLGMSLLVLPDRVSERVQNKVVLVGPDGEVAGEYHKSVPVPGFEARVLEPGDGRPAIWDTRHGRLGVVICFDLDFPRLVRQAGRDGVDVLVGPSNDWGEIAELHMQMATFRAVEQGTALLRPTTGGYSIASDARGRILSRTDSRSEDGRSMSALVPVRRVPTAYARMGDLFAWLSVLATVVFVGAGIVRRKEERGRGG